MKEYIDKAIIKAELEKRLKRNGARAELDRSVFIAGREKEDEDILTLLDTLEVKKEVLDENDKFKLMQKCVKAAYKRGYDMGVLQTTNKMNHNIKEVDLEKENLPISNSLTKEGLFTFEDGGQAVIKKLNTGGSSE